MATLDYIGTISTPYRAIEQCPNNIQQHGPDCQITLFECYKKGLSGLAKGDDILLLYWLENANRNSKIEFEERGAFSLRTPHRPNPIGVAVLPIESIKEGVIAVKGLDCLDGTPLLDIKPAIYREQRTG